MIRCSPRQRRTIAAIDALAVENVPPTLGALAERLAIGRGDVWKILRKLEERGYVERTPYAVGGIRVKRRPPCRVEV